MHNMSKYKMLQQREYCIRGKSPLKPIVEVSLTNKLTHQFKKVLSESKLRTGSWKTKTKVQRSTYDNRFLRKRTRKDAQVPDDKVSVLLHLQTLDDGVHVLW